MCWAAGSLYSRGAPLPRRPLVSAGLASLCGGILLAGTRVVSGEIGEADWTSDALLALGVSRRRRAASSASRRTSGCCASAPTSLVSTYAYVNPIVAVVLAWLILDEEVTVQMVVAGAAVLVSVALILRVGRDERSPGRGLFARDRQIAVAAATEPTA